MEHALTQLPGPPVSKRIHGRIENSARDSASAMRAADTGVADVADPSAGGHRRRAVAVAVAAAGVLVVGGVAAAIVVSASAPSGQTPAAGDVARVHDVLHAIDRRCGPRGASMQPQAEILADFASRYPHAQFRIDDENARTTSLLLVARHALQGCDPEAAAVVDRAYRDLAR
jgi:hypothetical protein